MAFTDLVNARLTGATVTAAGLFLSSDLIHVHFAHAASAAVFGRARGLLED